MKFTFKLYNLVISNIRPPSKYNIILLFMLGKHSSDVMQDGRGCLSMYEYVHNEHWVPANKIIYAHALTDRDYIVEEFIIERNDYYFA